MYLQFDLNLTRQPPSSVLRVLLRLLRLGRPHKRWGLAALGALFCGSLLEGGLPLVLGLMFLTIAGDDPTQLGQLGQADLLRRLSWMPTDTTAHRMEALVVYAGLALAVYTAKCGFHFLQTYWAQVFTQRLMMVLRTRLHGHLLGMSPIFYESRQRGDLASRTSNDVVILQRMVGVEIGDLLQMPVVAGASLVIMANVSPVLTLAALVCVPLLVLMMSRASFRMRMLSRLCQQRVGEINAHLTERLAGIRIIQLFTQEQQEQARFTRINEDSLQANIRATRLAAFLQSSVELLGAVGMLLALCLAGWQVLLGNLDMPLLVTFAYAAQRVAARTSMLGRTGVLVQQATGAGDRVFEILDTPSDIQEAPDAREMPAAQGHIRFCGMSFRYPTGEEVLRDVDLDIEPGQVVALAGPSGAGKTSLANLIPRFYDPTQGHIEIDGCDISTVTLASLRSQVGIVPQETVLFSGTIGENIAYGRHGATQEEVVAAAEAANIHDFITSLPLGYGSALGEHGVNLSGGQRQRIAIARALLKDPRILILDEATSSLDAESEALVQEALERLMKGRTTLVIAHRLSTIRSADRILVLSGGRIVEDGAHDALVEAHGLYAKLYHRQLAFYDLTSADLERADEPLSPDVAAEPA